MKLALNLPFWITGSLLAAGCSDTSSTSAPPSAVGQLTAIPIFEGGQTAVFSGLPDHPVAVPFRIRNNAATTSPPLTLILGCACQLEGPPLPERLLPGQEAAVTVKLRAPPAGRILHQLPIVSTETGERLAILEATLEARLTAPTWYLGPRDMSLNGLASKTTSHEFVWEAIEGQDSEPWLMEVSVIQGSGIGVSLTSEVAPVGVDGRFVKRRYRMPVTLNGLPAGRHVGMIAMTYSRRPDQIRSIRLNAQVLPVCTAYPSAVTLGADLPLARTAEISLLDRSEPDGFSTLTVEYDAQTLRVETPMDTGSGANRDRIVLLEDAAPFERTDVHFSRSGEVLCSVSVRGAPLPNPQRDSP